MPVRGKVTRGKPAPKQKQAASNRAAPRAPSAKPKAAPRKRAALDVPALMLGLDALYPDAHCELNFDSPFQLLIATILSAQCTDVRVNLVTPALFARFPDPETMAAADSAELEELIRSTGFYRNKAKSILGASQVLVHDFGGVVPQTMEELLTLPGVARKTANVLLGSAFGKNEGFVVDTHIGRLSNRLGLSKEEDPVKVERDLMKLVPREAWTKMGHQLIWHGRRVCKAQKPACHACTLAPLCPSFGRV